MKKRLLAVAKDRFQKYTREALDSEYNNRAKVKDFATFIEYYKNESQIARNELNCELDLDYGPNARQKLDLFKPTHSTKPWPVLLFFHGGYWKAFDKKDFSFIANGFISKGVVVLLVGYPLIPSVGMGELVRQCRESIAWTWRNISSFGGSPEHIYVAGHSAGGHLAGMMMATDWEEVGGMPKDAVKGICGISGIYDLTPISLCYINDELHLSREDVGQNSPVFMSPKCPGRFLFTVGAQEGNEFIKQSENVARVWEEKGQQGTFMIIPGEHHFSIVTQLNNPDQNLSRAIYRLIRNSFENTQDKKL